MDKRLARAVIALAVAAAVSSCASYTTRLQSLRQTVSGGNLAEAVRLVEKNGKPDDLLFHLERGSLLRLEGAYAESNLDFEAAERIRDDLYTISLSRRGLTFVLSDEVEEYAGEVYEGSYLHYYRILNFIALGDRQSAAVEARRLALRLANLRAANGNECCRGPDPFLEYFAGAVLESNGEWNDALISYRLAREEYVSWQAALGVSPPAWLSNDIARTARLSGITLEEIGESPPQPPLDGWPGPADENSLGQMLILLEDGWAPRKESEHLRIPIFKSDSGDDGESAALSLGETLAGRYDYYREYGDWSPEPLELAYFLDVAIPILVTEGRGATAGGRIAIEREELPDSSAGGIQTTSLIIDMTPASDLAGLAERVYEQDEFGMLVKTFARALLKYEVHHQAEENLGEIAGVLANIAGAATEKADTRSWLLLPGRIRIARVLVPPGRYRVELDALDAEGRTLEPWSQMVDVGPREIVFVSHRALP